MTGFLKRAGLRVENHDPVATLMIQRLKGGFWNLSLQKRPMTDLCYI